MAICSHLAPNGEKSNLYDQLEQLYGPDKAHDIWDTIRSQQFLNEHGDWRKELMAIPMDTHGEPTLDWVQEQLQLTTPTAAQQREAVSISFEPGAKEKAKYRKNRDSEEVMTQRISEVYAQAIANPDKVYSITTSFLDPKKLLRNGYSTTEMVKLLDQFDIPSNVILPQSFYDIANNLSKRILSQFKTTPVEFINRDGVILSKEMSNLLVPKTTANGEVQGYFTPLQYQEVTDSLVSAVRTLMVQDPALGANALVKSFYIFDQKRRQLEAQGTNQELRENLQFIHNQRARFAEATLKRLSDYGISIDNKDKAKLLDAVEAVQPLSEQEKQLFNTTDKVSVEQFMDSETGEFVEAEGRGLKDWNDISFELDPKDTASARIKTFIGTLPETDRGVYRVSEQGIRLDPDTIMVRGTPLRALIKGVSPSLAFNKWKQLDIQGLQKVVRDVNRKTFWMEDEKLSTEFAKFLSSNFPLVAKENFLGMRKLVDFESTFSNVLEALADEKQDFEGYMHKLDTSGKPNLQFLVNELRNSDQQLQNEFMKVMSKQYQGFAITLLDKSKDDAGSVEFSLNPINANRYSQKNTIINNWKEEQKLSDIMIISPQGERVIDVQRIRDRWLPILGQLQRINDWSIPTNITQAQTAIGNILRVSGVDMNEQMLSDLFNNMTKWTEGKTFAGGIARQFGVAQDGQPTGMFSAFIMKAAGMNDVHDIDMDDDTVRKAEYNNPLYTENSTMQVLAAVAAKYTPILHSTNHKSSEGKSIWDYGLHTSLSHEFDNMVKDFDAFKQVQQQIDIAKDNWLLGTFTNSPQYLQKIELTYMDGLKPTWAKRGTVRTDMSDREQLLNTIAMFQNKGRGWNTRGLPSVHYISLTHSDKTTTPVFKNMPRINTGIETALPTSVIGPIGSALYNIFSSEHKRIVNQSGTDFNNKQYDQGKHLFYFIPSFNYDAMKQMVKDGKITQQEFKSIWLDGQRTLTPIINSDKELPVINKILQMHVDDLVRNTYNEWGASSIISGDALMFDKKYVKELMYQMGIKKKATKINDGTTINEFTDKHGNFLSPQTVNSYLGLIGARDFALNYFMFNTSMSQLLYGDPAMTYKASSKTNATDLDHVDSTMQEYAKRLAKDIAPGQDPYWPANEKTYNTITLDDVKTSENYLPTNLKEAYSEVEATDAQELTTVAEHLKVMNAMGTIPTNVYNEMMKIVNDNKGKYYEFTKPEHLAVIMQPMKPVYSGKRAPQNGAQMIDYIKSSAYPLYPPIIAGQEIDKLRMHMESNGIDRADFASARKIGKPTNPLKVFSKDGKFIQPTKEQSQSAQQTLDRSGFRIQQEVPYDEDKESIRTVSQMNTLIGEGIGSIEGFEVPGHGTLSGEQVQALKETIRKTMIGHEYDNFLRKFGVDHIGDTITDNAQVYRMLADEAEKKGYTMNERQSLLAFDENGELSLPLIYNTAADKLEGMMMSMVKKIVDIKVPGKSFIQASSAGYTFTSEDSVNKSQVVWLEGYDGSPLKTIRLDSEGKVLPAQVMVPFNFTGNNGNKLKVEDFMVEKDGKRILDETRVPKELLQLVGARIPNQGHNSMLPIEVVGFLPSNAGDLIIVPSAITKQMGADFDVDKLFTYRRPYNHNAETNSFSIVQAQHTDVEKYNTQELQTAYFDTHYSVLTHPKMIEKVLNPLDKKDLKTEASKIKVRTGTNYYDVMRQLHDFQSGKDAKMLVALCSLSVTFNAKIQSKDLHLVKIEVTDKGAVMVPHEIEILDHNGDTLKLMNLSGTGTSEYDGQVRTKHDNHTTVQSTALDNAKDRTLDNLNITINTFKAIDALNQLETAAGEAVDLGFGVGLLTQPIIREFDQMMKRGNDSLSAGYTANLSNTVFEQLKVKYSNGIENLDSEVDKTRFNTEKLYKARTMSREMDPRAYAINQLAALELFKQLYEVGQRKAEIQSIFNQDTAGAGPNILSALDKLDKLSVINQPPIGGVETLFKTEDTISEQKYTLDKTIVPTLGILTQLLPYHQVTPVFNAIQQMSGKARLNIDQQRDIVRAMRSIAYTTTPYWWKDAPAERVRLLYNTDTNSLAKRVLDAKRTWGDTNYFLQRLDPRIADTKDGPNYVEYQAATIGRIDEEQNVRSWLELLTSESDEERHLGEDLLRYAFLTGGTQDANSFVKFVPTTYLVNTEFSRNLKDTQFGEHPGFIDQYFQHNPDMATQVSKEVFGEYVGTGKEFPETFKVPSIDDPTFKSFIPMLTEDGMRDYVSYKSLSKGANQYILYRKQIVGESTYYTRIDTLGNKYTDEYNGQVNGAQRSIFTENRALASSIPYGDAIQQLTNLSIQEGMKGQEPGYYNNVSKYEQIGLREGGQQALDRAINQIIEDPLIPTYLRSTAKLIASTSDVINKEAREVLGITKYVPSVTFTDKIEGRGSMAPNGQMLLNPKAVTTRKGAAETLLHESIHQRIQTIIMAAGFDPRVLEVEDSPKVKQFIQSAIDKFSKNNPDTIEHLKQLERIRYEAFNELRSILGDDRIATIQEDLKNGQVNSVDHNMVYALSSVQELTAHLMTNSDVAKYLNGIPSTQMKSILQRFIDKIADILQSFAEAFGFKVKNNSLLKEALIHTISLTQPSERVVNITDAVREELVLRTDTEAEAQELKTLGEDTYNRISNIQDDELGNSIHITSEAKAAPRDTKVQKVLSKLYQQLKDAGYAISNAKNAKERVALTIRYHELKEDIHKLSSDNDTEMIYTIARKQLEWVDKVLAQKAPTATDVHAAIEATNIWGSTIGLLYGDLSKVNGTDEQLAVIQSEAQQKRIDLTNSRAADIVTNYMNGRKVPIVKQDFGTRLNDLNIGEAWLLELSRAKPLLVQYISLQGKEAANNRDEEIIRVTRKLESLNQRMKSAGITADHLMQDDSWGLVQRLSNSWYKYTNGLKDKLNNTIEKVNTSEGLNDQVRSEKKAEAWSNYWTDLRKAATFVDTRVFFDFKDGTKLDTDKSKEAFKKLVESVGSEGYANELLEKAHKKFQNYLEEREIARDYINSEVELTDEERLKTPDEQAQILKGRQASQFEKWLQYNSPTEFLNKMTSTNKLKYINNGDKWVVMAPNISNRSYYDQKYNKIQENETVRGIYDDYRAIISEMVSYLPIHEQMALGEDFLPIISPDTVNSLAGMIGKIRHFDTAILNALTATEQEEANKIRPNRIPIMYTRETKRTEDPENRSKDLIRVAEIFSMMALHYKHMSPVLASIEVAEDIIKEVNRQRVNGEVEGKPLENTLKSIKYFKDAILFKKPKELEHKIPSIQLRNENKIRELNKQRKEIVDQIEKNWIEGEFQNEELDAKIEEIDAQLEKYGENQRNVYGSKVADTFIGLNQLVTIGFSPVSAVTNLTFGMISLAIHANGKVDFSREDMHKAGRILTSSMAKYYSFGTVESAEARKIAAIIDRVGIMGDIVDTQYGESNIPDKRSGALKRALRPFNWQRSGDWYTKSKMVLAMMLKQHVEVTDQITGEKSSIPLYYALNEEGNWDSEKYGDRPEWYSTDITQQTEWNHFRDKARKISTIIFGNQDKNAPLMAKKNYLLRLVGQFRMSWFPEGFATRFLGERYDSELGRNVKGRWRTPFDLGVLNSIGIMTKQLLSSLPGVNINPFEGRTDAKGNPISDLDIENMRKNFAGLAWTALFAASILMLKGLYDDQQKGKKKSEAALKRQLLINLLIRNYQDLTQYSSPSQFEQMTGNVVPATRVVINYWNAAKATAIYIAGDDHKDATQRWLTKTAKAFPMVSQFPKLNTMINRDLDDIQK